MDGLNREAESQARIGLQATARATIAASYGWRTYAYGCAFLVCFHNVLIGALDCAHHRYRVLQHCVRFALTSSGRISC